jgi:hypothetical protein
MFEKINVLIADYQHLFAMLGVVSIIVFIMSLIAIPAIIKKLPVDYFVNKNTICQQPWHLRIIKTTVRNTLGIVLICAGLIMLITPGQGLLSILAGVFVSDFPGKRNFERWLVLKPSVKNSLNWIRRKQNCEEFIID